MQFMPHRNKTCVNYLGAVALAAMLPFATYGQGGLRGAPLTEPAQSTVSSTGALPAGTLQIRVACGDPTAKVKTIAAGLKLVGNLHPAVLLLSGTCQEEVFIQGLADITLQGNPVATIDGGIDINNATVLILGSQNIALNNLTINGGGEGVGCVKESYCALTQVTIQNSLGDGAGVSSGSHLDLLDCLIQNNADTGLNVAHGTANLLGGRITGNASDGVLVRIGGTFGAAPGAENDNATIQSNGGDGIRASLHNTVNLQSAVITDNGVDGVSLQLGSAMNAISSNISNNGGHQLRIGDLSVARFAGGPTNKVAGANFPDVVCDPQFSTIRQLSNAPGATTNCPAELPPTP
jgi:hypothetical protein